MNRPPLIAVGLLSACVLAYEVLLTRLFGIVLWHHFAYMIISAAMLGYGASGTALTLLKEKIAPYAGALYVASAVALAVPAVPLHPSPYKDLSQALDVIGARVVEERSSPLGQVTVVENTVVPLRDAPGMSLNATAEPPPQLGVYVDGNGPSALTKFDGDLASLAYLDQLTSALPYHLLDRPRVLALGAGAGGDVLQALYHGSAAIDAVELDRNVIDLVGNRFSDYAGNLYHRPGVRVHEAEARGFVEAGSARYDLIQIALMDSFGAASAGLYGLSENYLYTVEAMQSYLDRLTPGGMLSVTRWLTLPPRDALKLFATAVAALEKSGVSDPSARLVMIRGWKTVTLLVKNGDFTLHEIGALKRFCRARSFDTAWYPGMRALDANRYNQLAQPYFYEGAVALLGPQRQSFIERYKFDIEPATDDRPHFFRFFKWSAAAELFALREQGGMALFDWSYPLLVATLLQALAASVLLIVAPLAFSRCRKTLPGAAASLYFLAIGFGFMFMEIAFIQKFVLFLSHPLYAIAVVLCAFLVFAALGGWLAGRFESARKVAVAVLAMAALALLYLAWLPGLFHALIHLPDAAKIFISVLLIAPLAMCMGVPFPAGMARLAETREASIPWAWALNGFASVTGAVLATLLAIHFGFAAVILLAVLIYALAAVALNGVLRF